MSIDILPDGTVRIHIAGEFTPEALTELLMRLSEARSRVARDPMTPVGLDVPVIVHPHWHVQLLGPASSDTLLALRHPGWGWIGFLLPPHHRMQLAACLATQQSHLMQSSAAPSDAAAAADPAAPVNDGTGGGTLH
jgi:hypothetical protein